MNFEYFNSLIFSLFLLYKNFHNNKKHIILAFVLVFTFKLNQIIKKQCLI